VAGGYAGVPNPEDLGTIVNFKRINFLGAAAIAMKMI
jgi:hypothetical protein